MILNRYIFREVIPGAVLGTILSTFVIFLQQSAHFFELIVRTSATPKEIAYLFALSLPPLLPMTIPFGALVGILIGLGRLSTDGEITAMRAAGVPSQKVVLPIVTFALLATAAAGWSSIWLTPTATRKILRAINKLGAGQMVSDIQPRVFAEQFPNKILYVENIKSPGGPVSQWQNVFIADTTPPSERKSTVEQAEGPMITVAREAIPVADPLNNRIQLSLRDVVTHEVDKDGKSYDEQFPRGEQALSVNPPSEQKAKTPFKEMPTRELPWHTRYSPRWLEARVELHWRLALPIGCLALALVGMPLGVSSRKGGKSGGYVTAIFLAFFCYYLSFLSLLGLAQQQRLPVWLAAWTPNIVFMICGVILLTRLDRPGDRDIVGDIKSWFENLYKRLGSTLASASAPQRRRFALFPQLVDTYVLTQFFFYFVLWLASWIFLTEVYTVFELLADIVRNKVPMSEVGEYLFFLTPMLIYYFLPISVLMAVLVTFGIMTKHNEVTAFRACGVSLHRLTIPVLAASVVLSGALFAFDYLYVPEANIRQEALRDRIKGVDHAQTYQRPDRKWIKGSGDRFYYYKYFDPTTNVMAGVSVYELDPKTFRLTREITAERSQWQPSMKKWIFQNGWQRSVFGSAKQNAERFDVATFPAIDDPPDFLKEVRQDKQMNFDQLGSYIQELDRSGFDTVRLRLQLQKKFSAPLFVVIMAMISAPFAFLVGNRGAMAGIGASIGVALAYLAIGKLFDEFGSMNHLRPEVAAWSPDAIFALLGLYLLLRMRS